MAKLPRLTAVEGERRLFAAGFVLMRSKGSHCIYFRGGQRVLSRSIAGRFCIRKS